MYVDGWSEAEPFFPDPFADRHSPDLVISGADTHGLRVCDLADLPEEAQDAVLLAGALVLARLDNTRHVVEA